MTVEHTLIIALVLLLIRLRYIYRKRLYTTKCRLQDSRHYKHKYNNLVNNVKAYLAKDGNDLCWQNRMELAKAVGLYVDKKKYVPPMDEFLHNCIVYRQSLEPK